jgi:hypothetical protein
MPPGMPPGTPADTPPDTPPTTCAAAELAIANAATNEIECLIVIVKVLCSLYRDER